MNRFDLARVAPEKAVLRPALPVSSMPGVIGNHMPNRAHLELMREISAQEPDGLSHFIAFAAGSVNQSMIDPTERLYDLLDAHRDSCPRQFWAGRIGDEIARLPLSDRGMEELGADAFGHPMFVSRLVAFLRENGIEMADSVKRGI